MISELESGRESDKLRERVYKGNGVYAREMFLLILELIKVFLIKSAVKRGVC